MVRMGMIRSRWAGIGRMVAVLAGLLPVAGWTQATISLVYVAEGAMPRLGMYANIGGATDEHSDPLSQLYLLDTGSALFVSASVLDPSNTIYGYGGAWWGSPTVNYAYQYNGQGEIITGVEQLGSAYHYAVTQAAVMLGGTGYTTSAPIFVNQGTSYTSGGVNQWEAWQHTDGLRYPPESNLFYGTFGAALYQPTNGLPAVSTDYANAYNQTPAGQLQPVDNGFIIQVRQGALGTLVTGKSADETSFTTLGTASVTLGITQETMDDYAANGILIPMEPGTAGPTSFEEKVIAATYATYTLKLASGETYSFQAATTLDTGEGGSPVIFNGTNALGIPDAFLNEDGDALLDGVSFSMSLTDTVGKSYTVFDLLQGGTMPWNSDANSNLINITVGSADAGIESSVNTALAAFQLNDILFNLSQGVVGFQPIPEPSSLALLLLSASVLLRRRGHKPV